MTTALLGPAGAWKVPPPVLAVHARFMARLRRRITKGYSEVWPPVPKTPKKSAAPKKSTAPNGTKGFVGSKRSMGAKGPKASVEPTKTKANARQGKIASSKDPKQAAIGARRRGAASRSKPAPVDAEAPARVDWASVLRVGTCLWENEDTAVMYKLAGANLPCAPPLLSDGRRRKPKRDEPDTALGLVHAANLHVACGLDGRVAGPVVLAKSNSSLDKVQECSFTYRMSRSFLVLAAGTPLRATGKIRSRPAEGGGGTDFHVEYSGPGALVQKGAMNPYTEDRRDPHESDHVEGEDGDGEDYGHDEDEENRQGGSVLKEKPLATRFRVLRSLPKRLALYRVWLNTRYSVAPEIICTHLHRALGTPVVGDPHAEHTSRTAAFASEAEYKRSLQTIRELRVLLPHLYAPTENDKGRAHDNNNQLHLCGESVEFVTHLPKKVKLKKVLAPSKTARTRVLGASNDWAQVIAMRASKTVQRANAPRLEVPLVRVRVASPLPPFFRKALRGLDWDWDGALNGDEDGVQHARQLANEKELL